MSAKPLYKKSEYGESLFQAIAKQSGEGISLANTVGDYIFVNDAFCRITGYSEKELTKMNVRDLTPPEIKLSLFIKVVKNESGSREVELLKKDGSHFWAEVKGYPIQLDNEMLVLGIVHDITERKLAEKELLQEKKNLQKALAEIKKLSGMLPICSHCKRIRDDKGYWSRLEKYIGERSEAQFSHSICPDCAKELYPDLLIHKSLPASKSDDE